MNPKFLFLSMVFSFGVSSQPGMAAPNCPDLQTKTLNLFISNGAPLLNGEKPYKSVERVTGDDYTGQKMFNTYHYRLSENLEVEFSKYELRDGIWAEMHDRLLKLKMTPKLDLYLRSKSPLERDPIEYREMVLQEFGRASEAKRSQYHAMKMEMVTGNRSQRDGIRNELIDFALSQYRARRKWSSEMLQKLEEKAKQYNNGSYIVIRDINSGEIVGSMRLARALFTRKFRRDPLTKKVISSYQTGVDIAFLNQPRSVERMFNLEKIPGQKITRDFIEKWEELFPFHAPIDEFDAAGSMGRKFMPPQEWITVKEREKVYEDSYVSGELLEPGLFAIDKSRRTEVYLDIYKTFLSLMSDPFYSHEFNSNNRSFYTYNDRPSLYTAMGFKKTGRTFESKGSDWTELKASPQDLLQSFLLTKEKSAQNSLALEELRTNVQNLLDNLN